MQALLITAIGLQTATTLSSSAQQSAATKSQAAFQSGQFETQARLSELQAESAITRGRQEETEAKKKTKILIGRQRAALSAQGIEISSGSALDIQIETAEAGAVDALTIKNNAFREATGHRIEAIDLRSQAGFARSAGKNKARNTLITGGVTAASDVIRGTSTLLK